MKISKHYGIDLSGFRKIRSLKDGISFFELDINWDTYLDDHKPSFDIIFVIFNIKIIEFNIYSLYHRSNRK